MMIKKPMGATTLGTTIETIILVVEFVDEIESSVGIGGDFIYSPLVTNIL